MGRRKYAIIVPDGAADEPIPALGGKTALEAARIPHMDGIARAGELGMVRTVPDGLEPGSDVAQMSLLGFDPRKSYTGRAPIEAAAKGIPLGPRDWVFRCNLVTMADGNMADHSAGQISTEEAAAFISLLSRELAGGSVELHAGVGYRHLLVCRNMDFSVKTFPPHDNLGKPVEGILPQGDGSAMLRDLIKRSQGILSGCAENRARTASGKSEVSSIWLWGQGRQTSLESFKKRFGVSGAAITAVDLARGLATLIGFDVINVPGATGLIDTNYDGKAQAAVKALEDHDIVFVHIEAPDEAGHAGNVAEKVQSLELIDQHIVGPVLAALKKYPAWRILVMPDHPTPVRTKGHSGKPVPFAIAGTGVKQPSAEGAGAAGFTEAAAEATGLRVPEGCMLVERLLAP
jgi:2,3-bisphosphoglycerate-independent phosphoglycerate mutase